MNFYMEEWKNIFSDWLPFITPFAWEERCSYLYFMFTPTTPSGNPTVIIELTTSPLKFYPKRLSLIYVARNGHDAAAEL